MNQQLEDHLFALQIDAMHAQEAARAAHALVGREEHEEAILALTDLAAKLIRRINLGLDSMTLARLRG